VKPLVNNRRSLDRTLIAGIFQPNSIKALGNDRGSTRLVAVFVLGESTLDRRAINILARARWIFEGDPKQKTAMGSGLGFLPVFDKSRQF
jgi:hypothetical protein